MELHDQAEMPAEYVAVIAESVLTGSSLRSATPRPQAAADGAEARGVRYLSSDDLVRLLS